MDVAEDAVYIRTMGFSWRMLQKMGLIYGRRVLWRTLQMMGGFGFLAGVVCLSGVAFNIGIGGFRHMMIGLSNGSSY